MERQDIESTVNFYIAAWNAENIDTIKAELRKCWKADTTYIDVNTPLTKGIEELAALIMGSNKKVPGRKFKQLTKTDIHNGMGRYTWMLMLPDGNTAEGMDFFEFDEHYYFNRIVGFVTPLVAL